MYDESIAIHYAAYRPPIHAVILDHVFKDSVIYRNGLDIGCGTGQSSQALKNYCNKVIGVDPSEEMLAKAEKREGIEYVIGSGENIPVHENSINITTIAGSLNYINREALIGELMRVCTSKAEIIVYDFEIDLSHISDHFKLDNRGSSAEYNHSVDLYGLRGVEQKTRVSDELTLNLTPSQVTHILLSENHRNQYLNTKYRNQNLFGLLKDEIATMSSVHSLNAKIYYSSYALS